jgi:ABC-type polysaccharide/polyol phosphate transport system ATPase subunit
VLPTCGISARTDHIGCSLNLEADDLCAPFGATPKQGNGAATVVPAVATTLREPRSHVWGPRATAPVVEVRGVSKIFRMPKIQAHTLKERALHPFRFNDYDELHALREVSFDVREGEFFGIVGRNGSGKSTLLKCLAGIYQLSAGELEVRGRLSPFLELGVGFNPDLTARDNVIINAIMLGLTRKQARERFDRIIGFAELEEFVDLKLKNYSSGMHVRLAFSVAIQVDADILLVDEVLAVGDSSFQQKCWDEFHRLKDEGKTILLVTHDMGAVERLCDRAILMERGRIVSHDTPDRVARDYHELNFGRATPSGAPGQKRRYGDRAAEVVEAWFEDADCKRVTAVGQGERIAICMVVAFHEDLRDPVFGFQLRNEWRQVVVAARTDWTHGPSGQFRGAEHRVVRMWLQCVLTPGRYALTPTVYRAGFGDDALDVREDLAGLLVHGAMITGGMADLPYELEIGPSD